MRNSGVASKWKNSYMHSIYDVIYRCYHRRIEEQYAVLHKCAELMEDQFLDVAI